ncbi:MAG: ferredoxin family protein [Clostridium sp.]|uniref:4Fe-4S dicluster domain-containing protein n=1 Tax=Clostridium sp. DSM 8431 TaxID=1761781 RepID=UPI0008E1DBA8|nr:ferredoxin family protein [Clostridium sp. DSM 8431]MCR4944886.1 ferredoxin family protein [Clostridium sp.]SFU71241.1 dissimilatory adenylylsulfate reductase beta subunit [Clostridium sp. DSM 8431]
MSIKIDKNLCVGCRKCTEVCPGNLIKIGDDKKAYIKYPDDCWGCSSCIKECKLNAVKFYLGADMGGRGSTLSVKQDGDIAYWIIEKNSNKKIIKVNKRNANAY